MYIVIYTERIGRLEGDWMMPGGYLWVSET